MNDANSFFKKNNPILINTYTVEMKILINDAAELTFLVISC